MDIYKTEDLGRLLAQNPYPGRGIVVGKSADGRHAAVAYFIMGRSENSRNRVFAATEDGIRTQAFDPAKVKDPSLIMYHPVRRLENHLIVTNGDQTDTVRDGLLAGESFSQALTRRCFEPDGPNWTPRISAMLTFEGGDFTYEMSILKSADAEGTACSRFTFSYPALSGVGHFLHTYVTDGNPVIPTFQGEPERVTIGNDPEAFASQVWDSLNADNKVSLYINWIDLATGEESVRIFNKNQ